MANMKEIHSRMKSIQDIMKITNAMYLISSSKMKKARKNLLATRPYFDKLKSTIYDILLRAPHIHQIYFNKREEIKYEDRKRGYIVITADKGLAGAYNHNVIKLAEEEMAKGVKNKLFLIGQVGRQYFLRKNYVIDNEFLYTAQNPTMHSAREITETIIDLYAKRELDDVYVIYTKMITSMKVEAEILQILPLERKKFERRKAGYSHASFYPSPSEVMEHLVPNFMKGVIYSVLVEAYSSEQQSRMVAMEAATTSAKDMLKSLTLMYNRARQSAITQEITEIVSGANSLKS
ncbi:MAG: synthase gamma chain [Bacillota bacterium]|jgi:F-type H+-transporting ATPase subunit gamma|nr:synthase gamma chain [Bacillota bacterium]